MNTDSDKTKTRELPTGWEWTPLGELGVWVGGGTPSKAEPSFWNGSIPWVSPKDMKTDHITDSQDHISEKGLASSATNLVPEGAVLIVVRSGILCRTLPVARAGRPVTINQDMRALTPKAGLPGDYVRLALKAYEREILHECTKAGTTVQSIEHPALMRFRVPVAPPEERSQIVARIETLFSDLDAGVAALERVRANLKRYRAAVLKAAVEGRLTEAWRRERAKEVSGFGFQVSGGTAETETTPSRAEDNMAGKARSRRRKSRPADQTPLLPFPEPRTPKPETSPLEPAAQLLARILSERRRKWQSDQLAKFAAKGTPPPKAWQAKYQEPKPPDTTNLPPLPEGWCRATIDQLSLRLTSGSRDWSQFYGRGAGTFVMAQNVRMGRLDLSERQAVDPPHDDRDRERSLVAKEDLLVTIVGAGTGDVCRVPVDLAEYFVCQSVALIRPVLPTLSEFLECFLVSDQNGQAYFRKCIYGQGRPHLGLDQIKFTPVALPPLAEQSQIVAEVERRLSVADEVEAQIEANLKRAARLRQAVLKRAFEGKLV